MFDRFVPRTDATQFGANPNATTVPMKTYNFHIRIGDITAVAGAPAKGTLVCRSAPMFVLSANPAHGTQAMADRARNMVDDCSAEILTSGGVAVGTICLAARRRLEKSRERRPLT